MKEEKYQNNELEIKGEHYDKSIFTITSEYSKSSHRLIANEYFSLQIKHPSGKIIYYRINLNKLTDILENNTEAINQDYESDNRNLALMKN
jgi:DNA-directed RNA polymerase subunit L